MRLAPENTFFKPKSLGPEGRATDFRQAGRNKKPLRQWFFFLLIALAGASAIFLQQIFFSEQTVPALKELTRLPVIRDIRQVLGANDRQLKGEVQDRINVLLLGQGGPGHEGPYLTDTIMLASFKPSTGQLALMSIPRDLAVAIPGYGLDKINAVNAYGETSQYPGGGAALAARVLEDTIRLPINYYVLVDFAGFVELIDEIGGVKINIAKSFTDYQYPDGNYGWQTVSFAAGSQTLNGERALQYARSRNAAGESGDFARAKRQYALLVALKDELLTPAVFLNPVRLVRLYENAREHLSSNLQPREIPLFLGLAKQADFTHLTFKVLDDSPTGPLYAITLPNGAYALAPKISDFSEIQFIAKNLFTIGDIKQENSRLVIQNGTAESGLAVNTAAILEAFEFQVERISNAPSQNFEKTLLYDLTGNAKPKSRKFLENTLQTKSLNALPPTDLEVEEVDFLIILGRDQVPSAQVNQSSGRTL